MLSLMLRLELDFDGPPEQVTWVPHPVIWRHEASSDAFERLAMVVLLPLPRVACHGTTVVCLTPCCYRLTAQRNHNSLLGVYTTFYSLPHLDTMKTAAEC